jgi:hypothetical protein
MRNTMKIFLAVVAFALTTGVAFADTSTPRVERREKRQQERIEQGTRSGQLTPREAHRLEAGQRHVDRVEDRAKADGKVTPRERRKLNRVQNHQSRRIHRLKHNGRHA